jgi:hypothetical protein
MKNKTNVYLCGSTFFTLLIQVKNIGTAREKVNENYEGLSDPDMMKKLIYVVTGNIPTPNENTLKKDVSKYRNCEYKGGKNIPFNQKPTISSFDFNVKNNYATTLNRMVEFTNECILVNDDGKMKWLVKALLEMIELDTEIKDTDSFHICKNGYPMTKSKICKHSTFELQSFLLGILHYIIVNEKDDLKGLDTYNSWYPNRKTQKEGEFKGTIGSNITRDLKIEYLKFNDYTTPNIDEEPDIEYTSTEKSDEPKIINNYTNFNTTINQKNEKVFNIGYIENFNL